MTPGRNGAAARLCAPSVELRTMYEVSGDSLGYKYVEPIRALQPETRTSWELYHEYSARKHLLKARGSCSSEDVELIECRVRGAY